MKTIINELRYCQNCKKHTMHFANTTKVNWLLHIALMFVGGLGIVTLAFALADKALRADETRFACQVCGNITTEKAPLAHKILAGLIVLFAFSLTLSLVVAFNSEPEASSKATDSVPANAYTSSSSKAEAADIKSVDNSLWRYFFQNDEMTGAEVLHAALHSKNRIELDFPYQHPNNRATIYVRKHPRYGEDVIFTIQKGQLHCQHRDCKILIKFDDQQPEHWKVNEPSDQSTDTYFIENNKKFIAKASSAKRILIQVEFYMHGSYVFDFRADENLNWK